MSLPVPTSSLPVLAIRITRMAPQQTILIADDDGSVRGTLIRSLSREGYGIVETWDGEEALRAMESGVAPDLLLSDVAMPGLSGPDLASRVTERFPGTKVAFITGYAGEHSVRMVTSGLPVLTKPFTHEQLLAFVRDVLGGAPG